METRFVDVMYQGVRIGSTLARNQHTEELGDLHFDRMTLETWFRRVLDVPATPINSGTVLKDGMLLFRLRYGHRYLHSRDFTFNPDSFGLLLANYHDCRDETGNAAELKHGEYVIAEYFDRYTQADRCTYYGVRLPKWLMWLEDSQHLFNQEGTLVEHLSPDQQFKYEFWLKESRSLKPDWFVTAAELDSLCARHPQAQADLQFWAKKKRQPVAYAELERRAIDRAVKQLCKTLHIKPDRVKIKVQPY